MLSTSFSKRLLLHFSNKFYSFYIPHVTNFPRIFSLIFFTSLSNDRISNNIYRADIPVEYLFWLWDVGGGGLGGCFDNVPKNIPDTHPNRWEICFEIQSTHVFIRYKKFSFHCYL